MSRLPRYAVTFSLACLLFCLTPAAARVSPFFSARAFAAEADPDALVVKIYDAGRERLRNLESLEDREKRIEGYDDVIARFQDNGDPRLQRLAARAMLERAALEDDKVRAFAMLDELIAKYGASADDGLRAEAIAAKLAKAEMYGLRFDPEIRRIKNDLYDEVIAAVGDSPDETMQRMAAQAMFEKQYYAPLSEYESVLRGVFERFGSSSDPYVKNLVAKSLDRLAKRVETEAEKNAILEIIIAAYPTEKDEDMRYFGETAKKGITEEGSFDADAANSYAYSSTSEEKINSALRQAWRCGNSAEKYELYGDIVKKFRHMKHDTVQCAVITALIERSFLDMTRGNGAALACFDTFAAKAPDYGTWLFIGQNRLWFVRGRANILAELDVLLDPERKNKFDSGQRRYFREATIRPERIGTILDRAKQLKSRLSQDASADADSRAFAAARAGGRADPAGGVESNGEYAETRRILGQVIEECGESPERLTQYELSRALDREAAQLDKGAPRNAFWRSVVEKFKTESSVYARHHVIAGYAKLIAAADGTEKDVLMGELVDLLDKDGTFQELLLLEDIRAGKADFPLPLLLRDW